MRTVTLRRITQVFFLGLFLWLCVVATVGEHWWQARNLPLDVFIDLDPLVALGTALATGTLALGLGASLIILMPTFFLGRFFCGWICPLGTLQQATGHLAHRRKPISRKMAINAHKAGHAFKYAVLAFHIAAAFGASLAAMLGLGAMLASTLGMGILDPIPLLERSVNLVLLPLLDPLHPRIYAMAGLSALVPALLLGASLIVPRAFCRYACPLGALLGLSGARAPWRIVKQSDPAFEKSGCRMCGKCEAVCEGACAPSTGLHAPECVLCMNCVDVCPDGLLRYQASGTLTHEKTDLPRRAALLSLAAGLLAIPAMRLSGRLSSRWPFSLIRPPGARGEADFLARCVACGLCMRVCPTNVLQPAGLTGGVETLWTPALDMRAGTSGCQQHCVACGHACPTGAIRALSLDERLGQGAFAEKGPIKLGTAFVDRGRCLPWAMDRPCIVCGEVCPVSPKAIQTEERVVGDLKLLAPKVDPTRCIGCGICEHECPVSGLRAIRVSAEGESRDPGHALTL